MSRSTHSSPSKSTYTSLATSLNTISLHSPTRSSTLSLRGTVHKSGGTTSKKPLLSAAGMALLSTTATTRKKSSVSPTKRGGAGDSENGSSSMRAKGSPKKGGGLSAGGGLGKMDVVSEDWDARATDSKRSPSKKSKVVRPQVHSLEAFSLRKVVTDCKFIAYSTTVTFLLALLPLLEKIIPDPSFLPSILLLIPTKT